MNKNIPYSLSEIFFINIQEDVLVLTKGNIYNKSELCEINNIHQSLTQPELVQYLFDREGPKFVDKLNGDFVILIYFPNQNLFYLFRDHLGIQPIAYIFENESFIFSSDIIGLCKIFHGDEEINMEPLLAEFRFSDLNQTPNKKVKKLLPGHYLKFDNQEISIIKYWTPEKNKTDHNLTYNKVMSDLEGLVKDSVHIRSDKRYNASAHVSSGLDSGVISALVRKEYNHQDKFYGYSWSPDDFLPEKVEFDERELVKQTCRMNDITPVFVNLNADDYINRSKHYMRNFGYLSEDKILEHAQNEKVNLIFSGWGGDEFISKGERGINSDLLFNLNLKLFFKRNPINQTRIFFRTLLYDVFFPFVNFVNFGQRKAQKFYTRYLKPEFEKNHYPSEKKFLFYKSRHDLHLGFLYHYHLANRTETWNVNGFLHGVEYRYPLLDKRIVEYMLKVPSELLVKGLYSRMTLREMGIGLLPEEVRWLRKGIDPVITAYYSRNYKETTMVLIGEIDEFKVNPDLYFVNFKKLEEDLLKFKKVNEYEESFIYNVVVIKMLHEFTKTYRRKDFPL